MHTRNLLVFLALLATVNFSCKDDKEGLSQLRTDLLTSGQWKMQAFTLTPAVDIDFDGDPDTDAYATLEPCDKDDYTIFRKDGKAELNEGSSKCNPSDPQTELVDWAFVNEEKEIIIDGDRCTIVELSPSRFRITLALLGSTADVTFTK